MVPLIKNNLDKISALCRQYKIESLYLTGSAVRKDKPFTETSDLDFILKYKKDRNGLGIEGFDYFDFLFALEDLTGRKVDLIVEESIDNYIFRQSVDQHKVKIYED